MPDAELAPLRVGVTGHRDDGLKKADPERLEARVRDLLARAAAARPNTVPAELLSPLAEGSDRIVARTALGLGYRLRAPLPLPRAEYARDFATTASRAEFEALLGRADAIEEPPAPIGRDHAYLAVGRRVLGGSDLLLAIWDGAPERGSGGTGQIVAEALASDVPVAWIHAASPHPVRLLRRAPGRSPPWREEPLARLPRRIAERRAAARPGSA